MANVLMRLAVAVALSAGATTLALAQATRGPEAPSIQVTDNFYAKTMPSLLAESVDNRYGKLTGNPPVAASPRRASDRSATENANSTAKGLENFEAAPSNK